MGAVASSLKVDLDGMNENSRLKPRRRRMRVYGAGLHRPPTTQRYTSVSVQVASQEPAGSVQRSLDAISENSAPITEPAPPNIIASTPKPESMQRAKQMVGFRPTVPPKPKSTAAASTTVPASPANTTADDMQSDCQVTSPKVKPEDTVNPDDKPSTFETLEIQSHDTLRPKVSKVVPLKPQMDRDVMQGCVRKLIEVFEGIARKSQADSIGMSFKSTIDASLSSQLSIFSKEASPQSAVRDGSLKKMFKGTMDFAEQNLVLKTIILELNDMFCGRAMNKERYEDAWAALVQLLKVFED